MEERTVCAVAKDAHVAVTDFGLEATTEPGDDDGGGRLGSVSVDLDCVVLVVAVQTGVAVAFRWTWVRSEPEEKSSRRVAQNLRKHEGRQNAW